MWVKTVMKVWLDVNGFRALFFKKKNQLKNFKSEGWEPKQVGKTHVLLIFKFLVWWLNVGTCCHITNLKVTDEKCRD